MTIDEILIMWYIIDNETHLIQEDLTMKNIKERFEALKSMNTIIQSMNDENAYSNWIWLIPDGADDDELRDIAENDDEIFNEACELFAKLIRKYLKYGLYIDRKVYGATD